MEDAMDGDFNRDENVIEVEESAKTASGGSGSVAVEVRTEFPETWLWMETSLGYLYKFGQKLSPAVCRIPFSVSSSCLF